MRAIAERASRPAVRGRRAFTLVEVVAVLAVVALAASIVLPRLPSGSTLRVDDAAWRLAERLSEARERAILAGRSQRLALAERLPHGIRVAQVEIAGAVALGAAGLEIRADGDALPARITLADDGGSRADVVLPPGLGPARVERGEPG